MPRETTLAAAAVAVVALALLSAAVAPGVLQPPGSDEGPLRPGRVEVVEAPLSVGQVSGETAELLLQPTLRHRGNPTENVSVRIRAIDTDSGLLTAEKRVRVGTMTGDGEQTLEVPMTVAREGGFRFEVVVFRNDSRIDRYTTSVRGLSALTPAYARSNVSFSDEGALPPVTVSVESVRNNRTTLELGAWLTATGPTQADGLSVTVILRQAESNLVAGRATTEVGDIRTGRTVSVDSTVTVPSDYNYYVDLVLRKDGVVIDTARSVVNLDPTRTISVNETRQEVEFQVGDFAGGGSGGGEESTPVEATGTPREVSTQTPGFGVVPALVALLATGLLAWRVRR